MTTLLFRLDDVPEDEADEVRQLLEEQGFETYETSAGFWKSGVAAIWLANPDQMTEARAAITAYQQARAARMQQTYASLQASGEAPSVWRLLQANPWQFIACLVAVTAIAALMVVPFFGFLA